MKGINMHWFSHIHWFSFLGGVAAGTVLGAILATIGWYMWLAYTLRNVG